MKIGLIGINRYAKFLNFACNLHVYAFQEFLKQLGHEVRIIDYKPVYYDNFNMRNPAPGAEAAYRAAVMRKARKSDLTKLAELAVGYRSVQREREIRYDKFERFIAERLNFTEEQYDSDLLELKDPGFDCYMCVTDVIWQTYGGPSSFDRGFMLGSKAFEGKPKISYAPSRGTAPDFTGRAAETFFNYLSDFTAISVREQDFADYIESASDLHATTVMDPVMLHGTEFWQEVSARPAIKDPYVLLYYVMGSAEDTVEKAVEYAKLHDLTLVELSDRPLKFGRVDDPDIKHIARYDVGLDEWLGYIEYADAVFTNSFHGCCFATLFETPLFVGQRKSNKVPNFLASLGLSYRRFEPDVDVMTLSPETDWASVRTALEKHRAHATRFVVDALEQAEQRHGERADTAKFDARRRQLSYPTHFLGGAKNASISPRVQENPDINTKVAAGIAQYAPSQRARNDGQWRLPMNQFARPGHEFVGWTMRFRIDKHWFSYMADGTISSAEPTPPPKGKAVLPEGSPVPHLPVNHIGVAEFTARWKPAPTAPPSLMGRARRKARRMLARLRSPRPSRPPVG